LVHHDGTFVVLICSAWLSVESGAGDFFSYGPSVGSYLAVRVKMKWIIFDRLTDRPTEGLWKIKIDSVG
jgi:hypothetical protein